MKITLEEIKEKGLYVSGRPATKEDASQGKAAFSIDPSSTAIEITIPQYAWHTDENTKERTLWIIIQAEQQNAIRAYGAINPETGAIFAGLEREFELIGESVPI
jgi:hypothetical protein